MTLPARPRLAEIRVLKVRLADMRRELHVLRTGVANVDVLKREVRARVGVVVWCGVVWCGVVPGSARL
jgi:hypothetical protein